MNPLIILGGLAALYYLFTGESKDEQNPVDENRSRDGDHHSGELSAAPAKSNGGKGSVKPDPEPSTAPTQE